MMHSLRSVMRIVANVQVYRGRLRNTGEEVALKVQRPGIGENIAIDMVLLRRLMTAFDASLPRLNLPLQLQPLTPLVDEFAARLFGELDYVQEGLSAEKFQVGCCADCCGGCYRV